MIDETTIVCVHLLWK